MTERSHSTFIPDLRSKHSVNNVRVTSEVKTVRDAEKSKVWSKMKQRMRKKAKLLEFLTQTAS